MIYQCCSKVGLWPTFCLWPMYRQNSVLTGLLEPVVSGLGYILWGIEESSDSRGFLIRLYIDHENGIDLNDCEQVSRQIVGVLDVEDPIAGAYNLEVSSPGLHRPLFTIEQFRQFAGERVTIRLRSKTEGRKKIVGRIEAVEMHAVLLIEQGKTFRFAADEIEQAHIVPQL